VAIEADDQGRIEVPLLGLMLGMRDNRVVCYDLTTGRELGDYGRISRDLEEADRRAEQQQQAYEEQVEARQAAERLATEARNEAERQREKTRCAEEEAERLRRAQEQHEIDRLAQAQRIRDLEEMLSRVQGGGPASPTT
jgi:hypothetical protein